MPLSVIQFFVTEFSPYFATIFDSEAFHLAIQNEKDHLYRAEARKVWWCLQQVDTPDVEFFCKALVNDQSIESEQQKFTYLDAAVFQVIRQPMKCDNSRTWCVR